MFILIALLGCHSDCQDSVIQVGGWFGTTRASCLAGSRAEISQVDGRTYVTCHCQDQAVKPITEDLSLKDTGRPELRYGYVEPDFN